MKMKHRSCCLHRGTFCNFYLYVDMYDIEALEQKSDENISLKPDESQKSSSKVLLFIFFTVVALRLEINFH